MKKILFLCLKLDRNFFNGATAGKKCGKYQEIQDDMPATYLQE